VELIIWAIFVGFFVGCVAGSWMDIGDRMLSLDPRLAARRQLFNTLLILVGFALGSIPVVVTYLRR
jgi:hypothetical protein